MSKEDLNSKYKDLKKHKEYKTLELKELDKEIVANYLSENFFTNFKQAQKLISKNKSLGEKVISFIKDKLARIGKNSAEYKQLKNIENVLQEIMDNKEISIANIGELAVQYSGKKNIKISKEEYAILREQIMKQNNIYKRNSETIDYAFTAENFYVYENYENDKFKIVKKLNIEKNRELINSIREEFKNESTIRDAKEFNSMLKILKNGRRSYNRNSTNVGNGQSNSRNGEVFGKTSESNTKRDSISSSGNNGTGIKYSLNEKSTIKGLEDYTDLEINEMVAKDYF